MANKDSSTPPSSSKKENLTPVASKIAKENLTPVASKIADLQSWRSKLDTQVKVYRDELSELKKSLNTEVDQLRSEFKDLRTTLQQQQEDVTASLRNLGLQDVSEDVSKVEGNGDKEENELPKENGEEAEDLTGHNVEHA
ncbi:hypothetical protein L484_023541 [Morus notabilis]|uniref:CAP-Gly domain-containing linker protein 1 n=1 Tax=Morus notabilis TaxID=981085 RepID=W9RHE5_9ROSA|nr:hypothetical protein L484_023541 [Morus notabilis]